MRRFGLALLLLSTPCFAAPAHDEQGRSAAVQNLREALESLRDEPFSDAPAGDSAEAIKIWDDTAQPLPDSASAYLSGPEGNRKYFIHYHAQLAALKSTGEARKCVSGWNLPEKEYDNLKRVDAALKLEDKEAPAAAAFLRILSEDCPGVTFGPKSRCFMVERDTDPERGGLRIPQQVVCPEAVSD